MHRWMFLAALAGGAGCGSEIDDRPATLEYITEAILAPSCGNAQCHSSFKRADGYVFDTVETARDTFRKQSLVDVDDPDASFLMFVLTRRIDRMPYDQALPDADIALIRRWIAEGAEGL